MAVLELASQSFDLFELVPQNGSGSRHRVTEHLHLGGIGVCSDQLLEELWHLRAQTAAPRAAHTATAVRRRGSMKGGSLTSVPFPTRGG